MAKKISREELEAKMDRGDDFVLVEALSQKHYQSSHLPGASRSGRDNVSLREISNPTGRNASEA